MEGIGAVWVVSKGIVWFPFNIWIKVWLKYKKISGLKEAKAHLEEEPPAELEEKVALLKNQESANLVNIEHLRICC